METHIKKLLPRFVRGLLFHLPTCGNRACGCAALL